MSTFIMARGLPGCGKSSWATTYVLDRPAGTVVRINQDAIRTMLHADRFAGNKTETLTRLVRDAAISAAMARETDVVISDDTNLHPSCEQRFRELCMEWSYAFTVQDMTDVPLKTCIARDLKRFDSVGKDVIVGMHDRYLKPADEPLISPIDGLPEALIVDIDGTLAQMAPNAEGSTRSPYDASRAMEDQLDVTVAGIVREYADRQILLVSGRSEDDRAVTEGWLAVKGVRYDRLWMRPSGDVRKDSIIKREIFDAHIRGHYNILFVLDDRDQVVQEWRRLGLKCLQVQPGAF